MSHVTYTSVVGSLMYAMVWTRLEISHAIRVLRRYVSKPWKEHWIVIKRVFRYLCGTTYYEIYYQGRLGPNHVIDI